MHAILCWLFALASLHIVLGQISTFPVNATARACEAANFMCAGMADFINWEVDGQPSDDASNAPRDVVIMSVEMGENRSSTLTVPAIKENDNVAVQCVIVSISPPVVYVSPITHMSVEGPGEVGDLEEFNLTADSVCIHWQQPYMCFNEMDGFEYHVSVEAMDGDESSTKTISERSHCFSVDPCRSYMVNVTPSVESYTGIMTSLPVKSLSDYYNITELNDVDLIFENEDTCNISFQIKVVSSDILCSNRSLLVTIDNVPRYSMAINNSSSINTSFTISGLDTEAMLTVIAKIVDTFTSNVLDESRINASTFSLQAVTAEVNKTSASQQVLLVQCEFARGSFAMGCFIVLDIYGSSSDNDTLHRVEGSDIAFGNFCVSAFGGGVIQLTAYGISANGTLIQTVLPLTQSLSVSPVVTTSQLVEPTPSLSAIAMSSSMMSSLEGSLTVSLTPTEGIGNVGIDPLVVVVPVIVAIIVIIVFVSVILVCLLKKRMARAKHSHFSRPSLSSTTVLMETHTTVVSMGSTRTKVQSSTTPLEKAPLIPSDGTESEASRASLTSSARGKEPLYEEASVVPWKSKAVASSSPSIVVGVHYAQLQHPDRPVPNIGEPPVHYTEIKSQILYENRKHVGITPDPPPPLPVKKSKLEALNDNAGNQNVVDPVAEIMPTEANQPLGDSLVKSSVGAGAETSPSDVPVTVQKSEDPSGSSTDPVANSLVLTSVNASFTTVLVEPQEVEEIVPKYSSGSLRDPVVESLPIESLETYFSSAPIQVQEFEGELPCAAAVPSVIPPKASTGSHSLGINFEGNAVKLDTEYAVPGDEEITGSFAKEKKAAAVVFQSSFNQNTWKTSPATLFQIPKTDLAVGTTRMELTSDYQYRERLTEPSSSDVKGLEDAWCEWWEYVARNLVLLTEEEVEVVRKSFTTNKERMDHVQQLLKGKLR